MKENKKGFTIVELVIVIAVIAILASVLVPTFSGIILKAQRSADTQVVRMLNENVVLDLADGEKTKHDTLYDAVQACIKFGMSPDKIAAKSDYNIAWESTSGKFVLIELSTKTVMYPLNDNSYDIYDIDGKELQYFIITTYDNRIEEDPEYKFSTYAYGNDWPSEITVHAGFDTGNVEGFTKISYVNKDEAKEVIIRTNSFETNLVIDGKKGAKGVGDEVKHYGYAYLVDVKSVTDSSYDEYGVIGRLKIEQGHINVMKDAEVFCLMELPSPSQTVVKTDIALGAIVHGNYDAGIAKEDMVIAKELIKPCSEHTLRKYVIDGNYVYDVCEVCGFSVDSAGAVSKVLDNEATGVEKIGKNPVVVNEDCEHVFGEPVVVNAKKGIKRFTCELCGTTYDIDSVECKVHSLKYTTNKDLSHETKCTKCDYKITDCCNIENGTCTYCGYIVTITDTSLYGMIRDVDGNPINDASVIIKISEKPYITKSIDTGIFKIYDLISGTYDVEISCSGYVTSKQKVTLKNSELNLLNVVLFKEINDDPSLSNITDPETGDNYNVYTYNCPSVNGSNNNQNIVIYSPQGCLEAGESFIVESNYQFTRTSNLINSTSTPQKIGELSLVVNISSINPETTQTNKPFMVYINNAETPDKVEFNGLEVDVTIEGSYLCFTTQELGILELFYDVKESDSTTSVEKLTFTPNYFKGELNSIHTNTTYYIGASIVTKSDSFADKFVDAIYGKYVELNDAIDRPYSVKNEEIFNIYGMQRVETKKVIIFGKTIEVKYYNNLYYTLEKQN